jgi:enolase
MRIKDVLVREISDFRGEPTIEVGVIGENETGASAQIPSGKSRGRNEAAVLPPAAAADILERLVKTNIADRNFETVGELDAFLVSLDGTARKEIIGGNLMLGISLSFARVVAAARKKELWETLNEEFFGGKDFKTRPLIFSNLVNGGAHTKNNLDVQEYMVVVNYKDVRRGVERLRDFYAKLGDALRKNFKVNEFKLGDEGGYSLDFPTNFSPIELLAETIRKNGFKSEFSIALDAAASGFYKDHRYHFGGDVLTATELADVYLTYFGSEPLLVSIEDPFAETDYFGFKRLKTLANGRLVVGDDLTTTNPASIEKAVREKLITGVIIKPNQIGTVTETCEAIKIAHVNGLKTIVSHRSGEVEDPFVIHFARAGGAYGVKIGAPVESRRSKFEELERIYSKKSLWPFKK